MKTKVAQSVPQETSIQLEEKFTALTDTSYCVDLVAGGMCYGRHLIEQQMVGTSLRLVNKLQIPVDAVKYTSAKALDTTGWLCHTADFGGYVDLSELLAAPAETK